MAVGAQGNRSRRDLIGAGHGAGVVALAGDGNGDGTSNIGEVGLGLTLGVRIGNVVIGARDQDFVVLVGNGRHPLVLIGVIGDVRGAVDFNTVVYARRRVIRVNGLSGHGQGAIVLGDLVVVEIGALSGADGIGIGGATHRGLLATELIREAFALCERTRGHVGLVLRKRRAVVDL